MKRLRSILSSPADQEISRRVLEAERALISALRSCDVPRDSDPLVRRRAFAVRRDLERALGAISSVRRIEPAFGIDPEVATAPRLRKEKIEPAPVESTGE